MGKCWPLPIMSLSNSLLHIQHHKVPLLPPLPFTKRRLVVKTCQNLNPPCPYYKHIHLTFHTQA